MTEYIKRSDAEAALLDIRKGYRRVDEKCAIDGCRLEIKDLPSEDVAPVIRGDWVLECRNRSRCSNCGFGRNIETQVGWKFCPNCGADMRGAEDDK